MREVGYNDGVYIVTVSPLEIGLREPLTYFSKKVVVERDIVSILIRNKRMLGIVLSCARMNDKASIKRAPYTMKKLVHSDTVEGTVSKALFSVAQALSESYMTTPGSLLKAVIPSLPAQLYKETLTSASSAEQTKQKDRLFEVCCAPPKERHSRIERAVHASIQAGKNICIVSATHEETSVLKKLLASHKNHIVTLAGTLTPSKRKQLITYHVTKSYPQIWLITPHYAQYALLHTDMCILNEVASSGWTLIHEPHISLLAWIYLYLEKASIDTLILGSTIPQYIWNTLSDEIRTACIRPLRRTHIVETPLFEHPQMIEKAKETIRAGKSVFIMSFRKGLYGLIRCDDCGTPKTCPHCSLPVSLVKYNGIRSYACHHCKQQSQVTDICATCGGWRLRLIRPGTEQISEDAKTPFAGMRTLFINKDTHTTHAKVQKALVGIESNPAIIVGTVYTLPFLSHIGMTLIPHAHHMLSLPHYGVLERARVLLTTLEDVTDGDVYIEDHERNGGLLPELLTKPYEVFMNEEQHIREATHFPPSGTISTITVTGTKERVEHAVQSLLIEAAAFSPTPLPVIVHKKKAKGGIRIQSDGNTSAEEMKQFIEGLHPMYRVEVDPFGLI